MREARLFCGRPSVHSSYASISLDLAALLNAERETASITSSTSASFGQRYELPSSKRSRVRTRDAESLSSATDNHRRPLTIIRSFFERKRRSRESRTCSDRAFAFIFSRPHLARLARITTHNIQSLSRTPLSRRRQRAYKLWTRKPSASEFFTECVSFDARKYRDARKSSQKFLSRHSLSLSLSV